MRGPTGKQPKARPLDYYLPPPRLDPPQRSTWQPPGVLASKLPINQASGKFLSAADMYRQDSTPYAHPTQHQQQPHPYADPRLQAPPRSAQPARPTTSPPTPRPPEPPKIDRKPSYGYLGTHGKVDIRQSPHGPLPFPTSPPPQQTLHVPTNPKRPRSAGRTDDTANERPSLEERPSLGSPPPRLRTLSQPTREFRRPPQSPPPLPVPDPFSIISPRRGNFPNPNDPFSVVGPRGYPLKQTKSDTTDGSHKGSTHACMSLNRTDRIRMIRFPINVVWAVKAAIEASWPRGIQNEKEVFLGAYEIQLKGNPWTGQGDESVPARVLMCEVLSAIYHHGWELRMSTDISQKAQDKDLLVFREAALPPPCKFLAISFNDSDRLRIIGGSSSNGSSTSNVAPYDVINATKNVWGGNVQKEQWKVQGVAWEFKLAGSPWWASGEESIQVRMFLLNMLDQLTALGWDFHASLDMSAGPGGATRNAGSDTDCWILKKLR